MDPIASAFAQGTPTLDTAAGLADLDAAELRSLVSELSIQQARDHLEILAASPVPKGVKKAAKKAIYVLKSKGIIGSSPIVGRSPAVSLKTTTSLEAVALVGAPGCAAKYWMLLAELPGASACTIDGDAGAGPGQIQALEHVTTGRLKRYKRDLAGEALPGKPILASADVAIRMIERYATALRRADADFPAAWPQILQWVDAAQTLGAGGQEALQWDLEAALDDAVQATSSEATEGLLQIMATGPHMPPAPVAEALLHGAGAACDDAVQGGHPLDRAELDERMRGLSVMHCDGHYGQPDVALRTAASLVASADILQVSGDAESAAQCLAVARDLVDGAGLPHEIGLLRASFESIIDLNRTWDYYMDRRQEREASE